MFQFIITEVKILSINIINLKEKLMEKNYSYCIYILHQEIKNILINQIKAIDKNFEYTNLKNLKNKCTQCLDYNKGLISIEFYNLSMHQENELYELDRLLEIYNSLTS